MVLTFLISLADLETEEPHMSLFAKHDKPPEAEGHRPTTKTESQAYAPSRAPLPGEMPDPPRDRREKSMIQSDLVIEGNLKTTGILEFAGTISGDVSADTLNLSQGGQITGDAKAKHLSTDGVITGSVSAEDVTLKSKSVTNADIHCQRVSVESGAEIKGALDCSPRRQS